MGKCSGHVLRSPFDNMIHSGKPSPCLDSSAYENKTRSRRRKKYSLCSSNTLISSRLSTTIRQRMKVRTLTSLTFKKPIAEY